MMPFQTLNDWLYGCRDPKEIPSCLGEMSSLKSIEVENCNKLVDKSTTDIKETQVDDYQNTDFEFIIKVHH